MKLEFNTPYVGDSDVILPKMIEQGMKFDLVLTDPPYNLNKDFGNDSDRLDLPVFLSLSKQRLQWCKDLLESDGSIIWFGIHHYIGYLQAIMYDMGLSYRRLYIWHYKNGFSRERRAPLTQYEPFLWFSKSNKRWTYNLDDVRVPYQSKKRLQTPVYYKNSKGERKEWKPNPLGAMRGDVWEYPTLAGKSFASEKTEHPTQKPESLITDLIKAHCPKNKEGYYEGAILDPFHGSGTLGVCCEKLNKQGHKISWVGIELEQRWHDTAVKRLELLQHQLF